MCRSVTMPLLVNVIVGTSVYDKCLCVGVLKSSCIRSFRVWESECLTHSDLNPTLQRGCPFCGEDEAV